jgi:hypothetical protein
MQHFTNMLVYLYEGTRISNTLKFSHEKQPTELWHCLIRPPYSWL